MTTPTTNRVTPRTLLIALIAAFLVLLAAMAFVMVPWINSSLDHPVGYSSFLDNVRTGQVKKVVQEGEILTVTPSNGTQYTVVVPNILQKVYPDDMQAAATAGGVSLPEGVYVAAKTPDTSWLGLIVTGLLPVAFVIVVFGLVVYLLVRRGGGDTGAAGGGHTDAASRLRALEMAWKAGLITDDERDRKRSQIIEGI